MLKDNRSLITEQFYLYDVFCTTSDYVLFVSSFGEPMLLGTIVRRMRHTTQRSVESEINNFAVRSLARTYCASCGEHKNIGLQLRRT